MYDYGNARVAALRGRLLDPAALRRLAEADSAGAFLALLERSEDWRPILRQTEPLVIEPQGAVEASIERHRSARLGALVRFYPPPAQRLVEALVLPLDRERIVALVRRRLAGEPPEVIGATIVGGALLDAARLGALVRAPTLAALVRAIGRAGLIPTGEAIELGRRVEQGIGRAELEARLATAFEQGRIERAGGSDRNARAVRAILAREQAERRAVAAELTAGGPAAAALLERTLTLTRLDELARTGRRDPLGIGPVAGYVAAVEAQAIRLRASLARVVGGWGHDLVGLYLSAARA